MSIRYLFPCPSASCDHKFELVGKQAGQTLSCPKCNSQVEAPKLGELKRLETTGEIEPSSRASKSSGGSRLKNFLFVSGLGLAIVSGLCGYFLFQHAKSKQTSFDLEGLLSQFEQAADNQGPVNLLRHYESLDLDGGLPEWTEQPYIGESRQAEILMKGAYGLFALSGIGLLMLLGSFVVPK